MARLRAHVQLVLRGLEAHRDVLERPAAAPRTRTSNPGLPTNGNGSYEWRGWLAPNAHPHAVDPPSGADRQLEQQARRRRSPRRTTTGRTARCTACSCSNAALPKGRTTPARRRLRDERGGDAGSAAAALALLLDVMSRGDRAEPARRGDARPARQVGRQPARREPRRQDRRSGRGDHGCVVAEARGRRAPARARAADRRAADARPDLRTTPTPGGSSYGGGWYGYVDEDLRALLGGPRGFSTHYCGNGDLDACRRRSGSRSTQPATSSRRRRAPIRPRGAPTRRGSGSDSRRLHPGHDALDEPPDLPAGRRLRLRTASASPRVSRQEVSVHARADARAAAGARRARRAGRPPPQPRLPRRSTSGASTRLREVCRTEEDVLLFTASGTGAFESAVANLVSPGEPHLVVSAGSFGERWAA